MKLREPPSGAVASPAVPAQAAPAAPPRAVAADAAPHPYLPLTPFRRLDRADALIAGALWLGSLALYTATQTPGLSSMSTDSNELVTKSALVEATHMPGSPAYVLLGKVFTLLPFGEIATRVTWMSALLAAVAVAALYAVTTRFVTGERVAAAGAAGVFALSLTFWSQAVIAELYAPNMGVMALVFWCLLEWGARRSAGTDRGAGRRWLLAGSGLFGVALGIHLSDLMFLPVFALFMLLGWPLRGGRLARLRALDWGGAAAAFGVCALGLLPYAWLATALPRFPVGEGPPVATAGWPLFYAFTLDAFSAWRFGVPPASWPDRTVLVLHLIEVNIGALLIPFLLGGAWRLLWTRPRLFYLLAGVALENFVFYGTYRAPDVDVFFIPGYWACMPLVALGLVWAGAALRGALARRGRAVAPAGITALISALLLVAGVVEARANFAINDQAQDVAFRDFYGNVFSRLPTGAWFFHHGASMGYDLLYYTRLYGARPDLHIVAGMQPGEPERPAWPPGPAYAGVLKNDFFLPAFLWDPTGANNKWYTPELFGMFRWTGIVRTGWLTLYRLSPNDQPPADWLAPARSASAQPHSRLDAVMAPGLTLLGVDLPSTAAPGRPARITRYWRATQTALPNMATTLGAPDAVEVHTPLLGQLPAYLAARGIAPAALPNYVIRDSFEVVIPSNTPPGRYPIRVASIAPRLLFILVDPAPAPELLPRALTVGYVTVAPDAAGPPPDPRTLTQRGPLPAAP